MDVGLRHLQFIVAAGRHRSFRRAAEFLHVRQSTLSRAVKQLEIRLGVDLFIRSRAGVRPTRVGEEFLETAERVVHDFDRLVSIADFQGPSKAGRLVLGLPTSFAVAVLRPVLVDYANECPGVDIHLTEKSKHVLITDLKADAVDLAIMVGSVVEDGIESLSLWSERILVVAPQSHPLASRTFAYWADLIDEVLLISRCGTGPALRQILATKVGATGRSPKVQEHTIGAEALLSLVAAGRGLALQSENGVQRSQSGLVYLEVHDGTGPSWIAYSACWKKRQRNPACSTFLALLKAHRSMRPPGRVPET